jgi:hypothetical protein
MSPARGRSQGGGRRRPDADGERAGVPLTHLDAELFEGSGVLKRDLID